MAFDITEKRRYTLPTDTDTLNRRCHACFFKHLLERQFQPQNEHITQTQLSSSSVLVPGAKMIQWILALVVLEKILLLQWLQTLHLH